MEFDQLEAFALAQDREAALAQLIPGSESHYYYSALLAQHRREFDRADELITAWRKRHGGTDKLEIMESRQLVFRLELRPAEVGETLRYRLGLDFSHQREVELERGAHPSALDQRAIDAARLTGEARSHHPGSSAGVTNAGLDRLFAQSDLDPPTRHHALSRASRPDHPRLIEHIASDIKDKSTAFGALAIHRLLLPTQLDELTGLVPVLRTDPVLVECRMVHCQPPASEPWQFELALKKAYLERLWRVTGDLGPAFNSLKAHVLYHRLDVARALGERPFDLFYAYLRTPRAVSYLAHKFRDQNSSRQANLGASFPATLLGPVGNDEELVRDYLRPLLANADEVGDLDQLIDRDVLTRWFAEIKILEGARDLEKWHQLLNDEGAASRLRDRVDIELTCVNRRHYQVDEPVVLEAFIKNVQTLTVNIFEVDALFYARWRGQLPDTAIDLDGLIANQAITHTYSEPPYRSVLRRYELPLTKPGVFVVELVGGGKSSRAVIRKGGLRATVRGGAAGHIFAIYDETGARVVDAALYSGGSEFRADERGDVRLPFSARVGPQTCVVAGAGRVDITNFEARRESYALSAGFFIARESLIEGSTATAIVRPTLRVQGEPAALGLLSEASITIETTDRRGISARKEIRELDLESADDLVAEFRVPPNLTSVRVEFAATVRNRTEQVDNRLQAAETFALNAIDTTEHIDSLHLGRDGDSHILHALGKNGEPRADLAIAVRLRHREFTDWVEIILQTCERGRIELGPLRDIDVVEARLPSGVAGSWPIERSHATLPRELHLAEGEVARLPSIAQREALFEIRGAGFVTDHSRDIRRGDGEISFAIRAGDYDLFLSNPEHRVRIRVASGARADGHIFGKGRILQASPGATPRITELEATVSAVRIAVAGHSARARVHIEAARFTDAPSLWQSIGSKAMRPALRSTETRPPTSSYVSGRDLGDEVRYVIERRGAARLPGAAVSRPALLLHPWARDATDTRVFGAAVGSAYASLAEPSMKAAAAPASTQRAQTGPRGGFTNLDFLAAPAVVLANLIPDEDGVLTIERSLLGQSTVLRVLLLDGDQAAASSLLLKETGLSLRDLRLDSTLPLAEHRSELRATTPLAAGESLTVRDFSAANLEIVSTLARVHALLVSQTQDARLTEFAFALRWPKLTDAEKLDFYSRFACHELNFFLARKDPEFTARVVVGPLASKHAKTFLDHYLINDDLGPYTELWRFGRLNTLERILLAERLGQREPTASHIRYIVDLFPRDPARDKDLFDAVLGGNTLEAPELAPDMPRPQAAPAAAKSRRARAVAEDKLDDESVDAGYGGPADLARDRERAEEQRLYRSPDKTKEWAENNYWKLRPSQQTPDLIAPSRFWLDYLDRDPSRPFLSARFLEATSSFSEMMAALAVLDLPFGDEKHETAYQGAVLTLRAKSAAIVFHKQITVTPERADRVPLLVSQNYFRADDRFTWEAGEQIEKYVTGEMLARVVYLCQVVLTNPTQTTKRVQVLLQIPAGAMAVAGGMSTRAEPVSLEAYGTRSIEYSFYFPQAGNFEHYGAQVTLDEELVASTVGSSLSVVDSPSALDTDSWAHVSQHGSTAEVLAYLAHANLARIELAKIAWRMRDATAFNAIISALEERKIYRSELWAYAALHRDTRRLFDLLRHTDHFMSRLGPELASKQLTIDPVGRGWYEHVEYAPLINARAHRLGKSTRIPNAALEAQAVRTLERLAHLPKLADAEWLEVATLFFTLDRTGDGIAALARVSAEASGIQLDYLRAFAAVATGDLELARGLAARHKDHGVLRWRRRFEEVSAVLARLKGEAARLIDKDDRRQETEALASRTSSFEFEVVPAAVVIRHRVLERCSVHFYVMDTELLFSQQPFLREATERFSMIRPSASVNVELASAGETRVPIPDAFTHKNIVIVVEAGGERRSHVHYASDLQVQVIERYGQLRIASGAGEPSAGTYVKVYARKHGGQVEFFKDGYSDLTGAFDYASLSTDDLPAVERFALLLVDDARGSVVREAAPPPL